MMKNTNKYILEMIFFGIVIFTICIGVYFFEIRPKVRNTNYNVSMSSDELDYNKQSITKSNQVTQNFKYKNNIAGVNLKVGCTSKINSNLFVKLRDNDKDIILAEWKCSLQNDSDGIVNKDICLNFTDSNCTQSPGEIINSESENYSILLSSDAENEDNAPIIYFSNLKNDDAGVLVIDNNGVNGDLYFEIVSKGTYYVSKIFILLSVISVAAVIILFYFIFIKKYSIQRIFLFSAFIIGFIYMIIITPYSVSDEYSHITTSYRYSNVLLGIGYQTDNGNLLKRKCDLKQYSLDIRPSVSTYNGVISHFFDKVDEEDKELIEVEGSHVGNVWQYIPSCIGITLARILNLGYIPLIYFARMFNFLFFISMIYLGIRKLPFGKITMYTVAMMPMALQQGMSCSYDSIIYGVSFLFISYTLYAAFSDKKIKYTEIFILLIAAGILATCKAGIFIFICFICLIIPKDKFSSNKRYYELIFGIIICAICMLVIFNFIKVTNAVTMTSNDNLQNFQSTRGYVYLDIIKNPCRFLYIACNTIKTNIDFYVFSTIGGYLGWSTVMPVRISGVIITAYIVLLIFSSFKTINESVNLRLKQKILFILIALLIFGSFMIVAFTWTPYGDNVIFGLQGRYFMTFLPLIVFTFRNNIIVLKRDLNKEIMFSMCFVQIITIINAFINIFSSAN